MSAVVSIADINKLISDVLNVPLADVNDEIRVIIPSSIIALQGVRNAKRFCCSYLLQEQIKTNNGNDSSKTAKY